MRMVSNRLIAYRQSIIESKLLRFPVSAKASLSGARLDSAVRKSLQSVKICKPLATLGTGECKERQSFSTYDGKV
jgi:hypothetical protein